MDASASTDNVHKGDFMSVPTMKHILSVLANFVRDKYGRSIGEQAELRKVVLRAMEDVSSELGPKVDSKTKTKETLHRMERVVAQKMQSMHQPPMERSLHNERSDPFSTSQETLIEQRDVLTERNAALGKTLERQSALRQEVQKSSTVGHGWGGSADEELSMDEAEFVKRFEEIRAIRGEGDARQDLVEFHRDAESKMLAAHNAKPAVEESSPRSDFTITKAMARCRKRYLMINSNDRNWVVDVNRYKYKVLLGRENPRTKVYTYRENDPFLENTATPFSGPIPNYNYDPKRPKGEVVREQTVHLNGEGIATTSGVIRNVTSFRITNVTVPTELHEPQIASTINILQQTASTDGERFPYPYITLRIEEISDVYDGTNDTIRRSVCQLQMDRSFVTPNGRAYAVLHPIQNEMALYDPTPLSVLSSLSISLHKPNGELLSDNRDGYRMELARQVHDGQYVMIRTLDKFPASSFHKGDVVRVVDYRIFEIPNDAVAQNMSACQQLMRFVNRTEGHEIVELNTELMNANGYFSEFSIKAPGRFDDEGAFVPDQTLLRELEIFNELNVPDEDYLVAQGHIMNVSMQHSIAITVEHMEADGRAIMDNSDLKI